MNPRTALFCLLILCARSVCAQQDSVPGTGPGSGGGRGDGSGGGRRWQNVEPIRDTSPEHRAKATAPHPVSTQRPMRKFFAGISADPQTDADAPEARLGEPLPQALLVAYANASSPAGKLEHAAMLVEAALAGGTSTARYAWGDSLLRLATAARDTARLAKAHFARGTALIAEGRNGRAFEDLRAAFALTDEARDPAFLALINARIGDGIMSMGGSTGAKQRYDEVLRIAASHPIPPRTLAHVLSTLAFIYADVEELDSATMLYGRAVEVAQDAKLNDMEAQALIGLGQVDAARQDVQQAALHFQQAIDLVEHTPFVPVLLDARMELGTALLYAHRLPEARAALEATRQLADSLNARLLAGKARLLLSEAMGDNDREAFRLLRETSAIASEVGSGALRKEVMLSYAERYARNGRSKEAFDLAMQAVHITDSMNWAFWELGAQRQLQRSQVGLKDRDIADLTRQREQQDRAAAEQRERIAFQRNLIIASIAVAVLVLVLAFAAFNAYRAKRRAAGELAIAHAEVLRQKERAEASESAKARFLANVSHEIRTPLNAIIGFTDLLLYERHDAQTRHYLGSVRDAGENLLVLINDVLDLSRMEAGRLTLMHEPFDLHRSVRHCAELLQHRANEQNDRLTVEVAPEVPRWVLGDGARLTQMLLNLVGNALKFTNGGTVRVLVDARGADVRFRVIDTGIGIAPDKLKSVFERFTQVHASDQHRYGGTGLGLSIVKELVALHKGRIDVESEPGKGTTFTLELPYQAVAAPAPEVSTATNAPSNYALQDRIILVAEDNPLNVQVTTATLKRHYPHAQVMVVGNGREAVDRVLSDIDQDIALVLMDVQMPVLDGLAATRELRAADLGPAHLPIVALTASVLPNDLSQCIDAGMDACVPKPFRTHELVGAIARLTGDSGIQVMRASEEPDGADDDALFLELVPERLQRLRSARAEGDHAEMKRIVHFMRFQLVRYDEARFAEQLERLLRAEAGSAFDTDVDSLIAKLEEELA